MHSQRVRNEYRSKTDLVASAIKDMIHSGELETGMVLRQRDIANSLGVSATPVREALRRLEGEGLLLSQRHRSTVVIRAEDRALYENAQIRAALESLGTELAAEKANAEDITGLEEMNKEFRKSNADTAPRLNRKFHFRIYEVAASPVLLTQLRFLWEMLDGGPRAKRSTAESSEQHDAIIAAIREHDVIRAGELVRHHILDVAPNPSE